MFHVMYIKMSLYSNRKWILRKSWPLWSYYVAHSTSIAVSWGEYCSYVLRVSSSTVKLVYPNLTNSLNCAQMPRLWDLVLPCLPLFVHFVQCVCTCTYTYEFSINYPRVVIHVLTPEDLEEVITHVNHQLHHMTNQLHHMTHQLHQMSHQSHHMSLQYKY